jgi:hypothetical protein
LVSECEDTRASLVDGESAPAAMKELRLHGAIDYGAPAARREVAQAQAVIDELPAPPPRGPLMRPNPILERRRAGRAAVGAWVTTPAPTLAETLGLAGFDAVAIDLQHGLIDLQSCFTLLHAISATPAAPLVRVSGNHFAEIGRVLDAGAYGVICPLVNSADDARRFVSAVRYPPAGERSWGPVRGLTYGGDDYFTRAGDTVIALAMVETRAALDAVDAIVATPRTRWRVRRPQRSCDLARCGSGCRLDARCTGRSLAAHRRRRPTRAAHGLDLVPERGDGGRHAGRGI